MALFIKIKGTPNQLGYQEIESIITRFSSEFEKCREYPDDLLIYPSKYLFNPRNCTFVTNPNWSEPIPNFDIEI